MIIRPDAPARIVREQRTRIVFLDFDGVLVNHKSWFVRSGNQATADPACVEALNYITDTAAAAIVVSSTWRIGTPLVELRGLLARWGVKAPVIGKTPRLQTKRGSITVSAPRGEEILAWLGSWSRQVDSFVILDDDDDMGRVLSRLVKTQFETGLTMANAELALEVLSLLMPSEATA